MLKRMISLLEGVSVAFFCIMTLLVLYQIVMRKVFNASPPWTEELARYAMIWSTLLACAVLLREQGHIMLDYFIEFLPPGLKKAVLMFVGLLIIILTATFGYGGLGMIQTSIAVTQLSPGTGIPMWAVYIIMPLSGILMVACQLMAMADILRRNASADKEG
ncbi:putative Tripartite ATP-independent periplasmic transporter DctQ component [uncultured delta proteobacterium]|uniref:Putative Tripartite ATP-independent periplasmic transporter DctQ component n=1 Tax=uncultured delta proteobacterium TaxID=34034 RepID=A0A212JMD0_9DELT|nr:putative Tripartite ATP-independent periplasmic transporter DctQ component [uncultured delta proteobacterium]